MNVDRDAAACPSLSLGGEVAAERRHHRVHMAAPIRRLNPRLRVVEVDLEGGGPFCIDPIIAL